MLKQFSKDYTKIDRAILSIVKEKSCPASFVIRKVRHIYGGGRTKYNVQARIRNLLNTGIIKLGPSLYLEYNRKVAEDDIDTYNDIMWIF